MDASARWAELMDLPEDRVPLDEAALLISARANPDLDVPSQLRRLDSVASEVRGAGIDELCRLLFDRIGLHGDRERYDDPDNSYIDRVLDRRRGIPISLSVLLIEIGRRCGIPLEGVGMPGHFLVRDLGAPDRLIDAFDGGRRLDHAECDRLLRATTGAGGSLTPDMLAPTGSHAILARMLANLDASFDRRQDRPSLAWVSGLRARIPDAPIGDRIHLARRLAGLGRFDLAATVLEEVAGRATVAQSRDRLLSEARTLRSRLN